MNANEYLSSFIVRANKAAESIGKTVHFQTVERNGILYLMDEESEKFHARGNAREIGAYLLGYAKALESIIK